MEHTIISPWPNSPDVAGLVHDRLSRIQQQFSDNSPSTLSNLRTVVDELSTIAKTCATVLDDIETRDEGTDVVTALKELQAALDWAKFLQYVQTASSSTEPEYLFRAHRHTSGKIGSYEPSARNVLFTNQLRKQVTVQRFVKAIARHLEKTQLQKDTGEKQKTMFTSMSPILEWTLHTTKNKWWDNADEQASLVVFNFKTLRETQGVALFRISDVIRFLESANQSHLVSSPLQKWARNCDEYVTMGSAIRNAIVQTIPWSNLWSMPIINDEFTRAYTLGIYRQWRDERDHILHNGEDVGRKIVKSAKVLAGDGISSSEIAHKMVQLIVKPGVSFWGINTEVCKKDILDICEDIFQREMMESMSQTSLT